MSGDESNTFNYHFSKGNLVCSNIIDSSDLKSVARLKDTSIIHKAILCYRNGSEILKKFLYNDSESKHLVMFWHACEGLLK